MQPIIIRGGNFSDERGSMRFVNGFDMMQVRRMYIIEHPYTSVVRAWQAHREEQKWVFLLEVSFEVQVVQPYVWDSPSKALNVQS